MSDKYECPYCEHVCRHDGESFEEDTPYEAECPSCGKSFVYQIRYIRVFETHKAPCLNGEEHSLKPIISTWHPKGFIRHRCIWCQEEFKVPKDKKDAEKGIIV